MNDFTMTEINYAAVAPLLIVAAGALAGVLVETFVPRSTRYHAQVLVAASSLVGALVILFTMSVNHRGSTAAHAVVIDKFTLALQAIVLILSLLSLFLIAERLDGSTPDAFTQAGNSAPGSAQEAFATRFGATTTEVFPLMLFAVFGMMLFPASGNLIAMFVALEILSLPLYIMTGLARRRRLLSQEASLKYFLLGAFSSAFFLFGMALMFGATGTVSINLVATTARAASGMDSLIMPAIALMLVGLLFKVGAVPFHMWTPDVYQGAPTPVTGFMAACTKVAAFGAIIRLLYGALPYFAWSWEPVIMAVAALTMIVGSVLTVTQTDIKRLLAYSSIAHAGFIMIGILEYKTTQGIASVLFYLLCYGLMTIAAFGIVALVRSAGSEATHLTQWSGLAARSPLVGIVFAVLLLAFAGIPLTSGFTAKFAVFSAGVAAGATWLVVIGVLASAITAYAYFKVIVLMWFHAPVGDTKVVRPSFLTVFSVLVATAATVYLGVDPSWVLRQSADYALLLP